MNNPTSNNERDELVAKLKFGAEVEGINPSMQLFDLDVLADFILDDRRKLRNDLLNKVRTLVKVQAVKEGLSLTSGNNVAKEVDRRLRMTSEEWMQEIEKKERWL